jgi:hypothetical protein
MWMYCQKVSYFLWWGLMLSARLLHCDDRFLGYCGVCCYHQEGFVILQLFSFPILLNFSSFSVVLLIKLTISYSILSSVCPAPKYEGCLESSQPFWISWEMVAWPWCNLAASWRRPYCASVNSHSPMGLVSRQWEAIDWACVLCDRRISQWPSEQISNIMAMCLPILQLSSRLLWQSITSSRSVSPPTAQILLPATSGFSQSYNRRWKRGDLLMWWSHSTHCHSLSVCTWSYNFVCLPSTFLPYVVPSCKNQLQEDRQCMCNITSRLVYVATLAVEKQ